MKKILFFGELPPKTTHGVSFSNEINIKILGKHFAVSKIVEFTDIREHQRVTLKKNLQLLKYGFSVVKAKSNLGAMDFFYLPFSISFQGALKVLYLSGLFRLVNPSGKIILHVYRSDLPLFYGRSRKNKTLVNLILNLADSVIILSPSMVSAEMQRRYPVFKVVPNTVNDTFSTKPIPRKNHFIFISHYIRSKGIFDLLDAMKTVADRIKMTLHCYGQFTNVAEKEQILLYQNTQIQINPFIAEKDKLLTLAEAGCLVLPSHNEGQPQVIFEAMSVGTPVIATKVGDVVNMLGEEYPFLVEPHSVKELSEAMLKFDKISDMEKESWSNYLKERFKTNFSMDAHARELLEVFGQNN